MYQKFKNHLKMMHHIFFQKYNGFINNCFLNYIKFLCKNSLLHDASCKFKLISLIHCSNLNFSRELLQTLTQADLNDTQFPYSTSKLITIAGHLCRALRFSHVGELGWDLHMSWDSCFPIYKAICEQGRKEGLRLAGFRAFNSLGCETGTIFYFLFTIVLFESKVSIMFLAIKYILPIFK